MRILLSLLLLLSPPALACGPDADCMVGERSYRIAMPEGHDGTTPVPALIWAHGFRGSAAGMMNNGSMRRMMSDAGFALIAAQGIDGRWELPLGPGSYDSDGSAEFSFFDAVIADATQRFAVDPDRIVASGFSLGGMMVWNLVCARPDSYAGFIPYSGTFWLKPPEDCAAPVSSIVHIHGTRDTTVPLTGRAIRETKQGEVEEALDMYATFGAFGPAEMSVEGSLTCRNRSNAQGEILDFCLFDGGHSFRTEYLQHGLNTLIAAGQV